MPFLENLSKHGQSDIPDSLLVLKLSDLIRDSRLLQIFDSYLRDINGPAHYLDCFLQANDCLHRLQAIKVIFKYLYIIKEFRTIRVRNSTKYFRIRGSSFLALFTKVLKLKLNCFRSIYRTHLIKQFKIDPILD